METVTMDFSFPKTSRDYGRFLVTSHDHFPEIQIRHVEAHHTHAPGRVIVSVSVPEHIAILLKLEFGANIVKRPDLSMKGVSEYHFIKLKLKEKNLSKNNIDLDFEFNIKNLDKYFNEGTILK